LSRNDGRNCGGSRNGRSCHGGSRRNWLSWQHKTLSESETGGDVVVKRGFLKLKLFFMFWSRILIGLFGIRNEKEFREDRFQNQPPVEIWRIMKRNIDVLYGKLTCHSCL